MYVKISKQFAFLALTVATIAVTSFAQNKATDEQSIANNQALPVDKILPCGYVAPSNDKIRAMREEEKKGYGAASICKTLCSISKHFCPDITIPTYVYSVHASDGTGRIPEADINTMVADANERYGGLRIKLDLQSVEYVPNTAWYQSESASADEIAMMTQLKKGGLDVLTVYVKLAAMGNGARACGYAFLARDAAAVGVRDGIVMNIDCVLNKRTLAHEVGQ